MASMLSKLWDDVAGGSPPEKGMKQLRKQNSANSALFRDGETAEKSKERRLSLGEYRSTAPQSIPIIKKPQLENLPMLDIPESPASGTPCTPPNSPAMMASPSAYSKEKDNVWRSVFHSGQNKVKRADKFEKVQDNSPTVYDWVVITALEG
jgi:hypothetical protein